MTCHDATTLTREDLLQRPKPARPRPRASQPHPVDGRPSARPAGLALDCTQRIRLENIDLEVAAELGVAVHSSPEGNRDAVAEHATGLLLNLLNHIHRRRHDSGSPMVAEAHEAAN